MPDTDTPDTPAVPKCGDVLPNGAIVVEYVAVRPSWGIVLANRGTKHEPWVTWTMDPSRLDSTESGSYRQHLGKAVQDLYERAERHGA